MQLHIKILIEDMFYKKFVATEFNFSKLQIVLFSLIVFRFHVVFDLLMLFAGNLHNLVPG